MKPKTGKQDIKTLLSWMREAQLAHADWRAESWHDCAMRDGDQWTDEQWQKAINSGIDPLTINRIFPVCNLIKGLNVTNKSNLIAKGRTQMDTEVSEMMSEGLQFVMDQNLGEHEMNQAFDDSVDAGIGFVGIFDEPDPRKEKIKMQYKDWTELWWDPFAMPYLYGDQCRYVFTQPWVDVEDLIAAYPKKASEINQAYSEFTGTPRSAPTYAIDDEANMVEDRKKLYGLGWANSTRNRVRPCQMYYPVFVDTWFAMFPDGRAEEIADGMDINVMYPLIQSAQEIVKATVRKMHVCTFLGDLELEHVPTSYPHDEFPYVPFVAYVDRYKQPYGVPRQLRGQNEEVNKRRSMVLAQLKTRRVLMEEGAVDKDKAQNVYDEANKLDGFIIVKDGKMGAVQLMENDQRINAQIQMMQQSEQEIKEISGANDEQMGYGSNATSGVALEKKMAQSSTMTATLFERSRYAKARIGHMLMSMIQGRWTKEKVLRITDKLTKADRFVVLNQVTNSPDGRATIKNNITQGKYDLIISEAPKSDTVREQQMNLIIEWIKKSPPEIIPHLFGVAIEMSDLPNKEILLAKIRPILGVKPGEEDMSPDELKAKVIQEMEAQAQSQQAKQQKEDQLSAVQLESLQLANQKLTAEIERLIADARSKTYKTGADVQATKIKMEIDEKHRFEDRRLNQVNQIIGPSKAVSLGAPPTPRAPGENILQGNV